MNKSEIKTTAIKYKKLLIPLALAHLFILGTLVWNWEKTLDSYPWTLQSFWKASEISKFNTTSEGEEKLKVVSRKRGPTCPDVLGSMLDGQWITRTSSAEERAVLKRSGEMARRHIGVAITVHKGNGECGDDVFTWFRRLCDPDGHFPCCYKGKCVSKEQKDCLCEDCIDMRQRVNAELASWVPKDPACKISSFKGASDTCRLLKNMTIYFIGDSLLRHIYVSLLALLRSDVRYGPLKANSLEKTIRTCQGTVLYSWSCKKPVDKDSLECNHTTHVKFLEYWDTGQTNLTLQTIDELRKIPNSFVIVGIGIHDNFEHDTVIKKFLHPFLNKISEAEWPKALWVTSGPPGLLKTRTRPEQGREKIVKFNTKVRQTLEKRGLMPIYNTFDMTKDTVSFDGTHFGKGVNDVKVQILLNYFWELRSKSKDPNLHLDFQHD